MEKLKLKELITIYEKGNLLQFDIHSHPRIANNVLRNGAVIGEVTLSTAKAYGKWLNSRSVNDKDF
jgi:hypothetical protein